MTKIANVVGARPQFIKAGPISKALARAGVEEVLVHTGQHYDPLMSQKIMRDIGLREPDFNLGVGSASHGMQTAAMLQGVEAVLEANQIDAVLVYGDTNSTIAGALAAAKLGVFTGHIEAGLRSFNRRMPEELNRVATDHLSDLLFAPTANAMEHLRREGLGSRAVLTGDVMVDALRSVDLTSVRIPDWASGDYYIATIHRAENTDDAARLQAILHSLDQVDMPVHLLSHPRLRERLIATGFEPNQALQIHAPLPYAEMLATLEASAGLYTDSGGLQKEAFILGVRCVTIRAETEWPETLEGSWNVLAESEENLAIRMKREVVAIKDNPFGNGDAAVSIVRHLIERLGWTGDIDG